MATEIERKFLVTSEDWRAHVYRSEVFRQGYLVSDSVRSVRVRLSGDQAWLNIKSATVGASRSEYEYLIPQSDAHELLQLCEHPLLEKTRHWIKHGPHIWEIDEFAAANIGLVVAEVELERVDEALSLPNWIGCEVTDDIRYYNVMLARQPYSSWNKT